MLYPNEEPFEVGGSKTLRSGPADAVTLVGAGVTLHEALKAAETLAGEGIAARVIDLYSIKPLDVATLERAARYGARVLPEEENRGHTAASTLGARRLARDGIATMMQVPADLPLLTPADVAALRARIHATWGAPFAALYEIRAYGPSSAAARQPRHGASRR